MTKQIQIGSWDSPGIVIEVSDDATLGQALQEAGMTLQSTQRVAAMNTNTLLSLNDLVSGGEQYIITQNHVSG
jgi:hypothetical protein